MHVNRFLVSPAPRVARSSCRPLLVSPAPRVARSSCRPLLVSPAPRVAKIALITLVLAVLSSQQAHAQVTVNGSIGGYVDGEFQHDAPTHTASSGPVSTSLQNNLTGESGSIEGKLKTTASYGDLHTYAYCLTNQTGGLNGKVDSDSIANAGWEDILTVTSGTLPMGSLCQIKFNMLEDGSLSATVPSGNVTYAFVQAEFNVSNLTNQGEPAQRQQYQQSVGYGGANENDPFILFNAQVGDQIGISGDLASTVVADNGSLNGTVSATSDYLNTANFYADPLTPGVSLISASGHNYSSPVPEASTGLSFGGLLLGLGGIMLRARKRSRG